MGQGAGMTGGMAAALTCDVAIVGGGLSGLALASRLHAEGLSVHLFEARARLGGRVLSVPSVHGGALDLGPAWVWPGQAHVARLVREVGLRVFPQFAEGAICWEDTDGTVHRGRGFASMAGAFRVEGGMAALVEALAARLPAERLHLQSPVRAVRPDGVTLADGRRVVAGQVALALPPRLAAGLDFAPGLAPDLFHRLRAIPTWMAGHAKLLAVYDRPFWRMAGLSGDASSRRGPLMEIHDASGPAGTPAVLFGFVGLPARMRAGRAAEVEAAAIAQLSRIFGPEAGQPRQVIIRDWAEAQQTATAADQTPPPGHPDYRPDPALIGLWEGRLHFAVTELASDAGGLIEGALVAAEDVSARILAPRAARA